MLRPNSTITAAIVSASVLCSPLAYGFDGYANIFPNTPQVQFCYASAMVGMDSVINSRIGVPPQDVVALARISKGQAEYYSHDILKTMLNAYFWEGSPHSYAINVFYQCAQISTNHSAAADDLPIP